MLPALDVGYLTKIRTGVFGLNLIAMETLFSPVMTVRKRLRFGMRVVTMGQMWWMDSLPYRVVSPGGDVLFQAPINLRHPPRVERDLMELGCSIWVNDKRLTRKELPQRGQEDNMQGLSRPGG